VSRYEINLLQNRHALTSPHDKLLVLFLRNSTNDINAPGAEHVCDFRSVAWRYVFILRRASWKDSGQWTAPPDTRIAITRYEQLTVLCDHIEANKLPNADLLECLLLRVEKSVLQAANLRERAFLTLFLGSGIDRRVF
jgi:hypothetical protein